MEKLILYKDKQETIKCKIDIEGADIKNSNIRLCIETADNINMFFSGKINEDGNCEINIPALKLFKQDKIEGNYKIEAIIENSYFCLFESVFEIKNSIVVKMTTQDMIVEKNQSEKKKINFSFTTTKIEEKTEEIKNEIEVKPSESDVVEEKEIIAPVIPTPNRNKELPIGSVLSFNKFSKKF